MIIDHFINISCDLMSICFTGGSRYQPGAGARNGGRGGGRGGDGADPFTGKAFIFLITKFLLGLMSGRDTYLPSHKHTH